MYTVGHNNNNIMSILILHQMVPCVPTRTAYHNQLLVVLLKLRSSIILYRLALEGANRCRFLGVVLITLHSLYIATFPLLSQSLAVLLFFIDITNVYYLKYYYKRMNIP